MSDLRIKPNVANGDLPKDFDDGKNKEIFDVGLFDILNPFKMKEVLDKANGHTNKDQDKQ